jgi:hypothetical protein
LSGQIGSLVSIKNGTPSACVFCKTLDIQAKNMAHTDARQPGLVRTVRFIIQKLSLSRSCPELILVRQQNGLIKQTQNWTKRVRMNANLGEIRTGI